MSTKPRLSSSFRARVRGAVAFAPPRPVVVITATWREVALAFLAGFVIVCALYGLLGALS